MEIQMRPFIHLFKTRNKYYCYDINTCSILRITENVYNILESCDVNAMQTDEIKHLYEMGYLHPYDDDIILEHPATCDIPSYLNEGMQQLILQLTQNCNLRCKYCVYSGSYRNRTHTNKRMDFKTAKNAIDFYYKHSSAADVARIGLYGGEPLLEFALIKKVVSYSEALFNGKKLRFNMTSNATLLNEEIVDFLQTHNFDLMISLDGPKDIQDKNRVFADGEKGTFDVIMEKLEMIQKRFPEYMSQITFNAVIDTENDFTCSSDFFTYDFLKSAIVSSTAVSDRDIIKDVDLKDTFYINYQYELFKSFLSYIGKLDEEQVSKLISSHKGVLINSVHERISSPYRRKGKCHPNGPCIAGANRLFVNVDGNFFPCERVSETNAAFQIGSLETGISTEKVAALLNTGIITEEDCKHCWAINLCSICAADFGGENGLSVEKKREKCVMARREAEESMKEYCTLREYGYKFDS